MAGPAHGQSSAGRLWFALRIWNKMRNDTCNFAITIPKRDGNLKEEQAYGYRIDGIGIFHRGTAVDIYKSVLELEN